MRTIIYSRCSTTEEKQDTEVQLKELRKYCDNNNWEYDEVSEYGSGSKGVPPKLQQVLDLIAEGHYKVMVVHSLDRFSRLTPSITEQMLKHIIDCKCRFIALQERLDSEDKMMWFCFKGIWLYFANQYSIKLSEKVKLGMERAREKGIHVGRPRGSKDKKKRSTKGYHTRKYKFKVK